MKVERCIEELKYVISKFNIKVINFDDDLFTVNKKWLFDFLEQYKKEIYDEYKIKFVIESRVDTINEEVIKKLKESGCLEIQFGVESGDQKILDRMKKGIKVKDVKKVFKWCDEIGIETVAFFILGYPGETKKSIEKTLRLAKELKSDFVTFNLFTPLPGSEIYEILKPKKDWEKFDFTFTSFCDISSKTMRKIIREAYRTYYLRISYVLRRILKTKDPYRIIHQNYLFWTKKSGVLWEFLSKG